MMTLNNFLKIHNKEIAKNVETALNNQIAYERMSDAEKEAYHKKLAKSYPPIGVNYAPRFVEE